MYAAALIFSPTRSIIRNLFWNEEPRWIVTKLIVEDDWNACLQTLKGHIDWVTSVAWSHNVARLASASDNDTVKIWDTHNQARCAAEPLGLMHQVQHGVSVKLDNWLGATT